MKLDLTQSLAEETDMKIGTHRTPEHYSCRTFHTSTEKHLLTGTEDGLLQTQQDLSLQTSCSDLNTNILMLRVD